MLIPLDHLIHDFMWGSPWTSWFQFQFHLNSALGSHISEKCEMNWSVLVRGSRELLQCGISYFLQRSSTSEMKQRAPVSYRAKKRDFQAVTQARRVVLMWKYHHLCLTAAHQPLNHLPSCDFPPQICLLFNWEIDPLSVLSESLLSHLNLSNSVKQLAHV